MPLSSIHVEHLVAATLSVNGYSADRAVALMPAFRRAGLLDAAKVAALEGDALIAACEGAGYTRGGFVPIIAYRLLATLKAAADGQLDALPGHVAANRPAEFAAVLRSVHGFGPRTAETAWALWADA